MSRPRILIVEDDDDSTTYLEETLRTSGYEMLTAVASGEQAVQIAAADPPEVVLMDIMLAGELDGIAAAAQIRATRDIPVIYLTAYSDGDIVDRVKTTEPFGYLLKPVQPQELRITIEMALYKHKLEADLRETNRQLEEEIIERKQAEEELKHYRDHLEQMVTERTVELTRSNERLQQEIAERKILEDALNKRLVALTEPLETADIAFTDLFDIEGIQTIQDAFAAATNVAAIITHPNGTPLTRPSNFCRLCNEIIRQTEKGRANCFHSDAIIGKQNPEGPTIQLCLSGGLWDAGASIVLGGKHVANWLIGQVKNDALDEEKLIPYAREIGADEKEFRRALQDVPVMTTEQFRKIANALFVLANELSLKAYQNVQQARFITARKRAEAQLAEERNLLRTLIDNLPDAIYVKDPASRFLLGNLAVAQIMGATTPDEIMGKTDFDFYPQELAAQYYADEQEVIRSGRSRVNQEELIITSAGRRLWLLTTQVPLWDRQGNIAGLIGIGRDITARKQMENDLQRHIAELSTLQATVLDIITPHDLPTLLQTIVERAARLLNARGGGLYLSEPDQEHVRCVVSYHTPRDYTGTVLKYGEGAAGTVAQTSAPLIINDYRFWNRRAAVYEEEQPFTAVLSVPMIWQNQVTGVIHVLDDGENRKFTPADLDLLTLFANHAAIAVEQTRLHDHAQQELTERKRAEEALRASEEKFSVAFRANPASASISTLQEGRYIDVNDSFLQSTGYDRAEVLGHTVFELNLWAPPEQAQHLRRMLQEHGIVRNVDYTFRRKTGEILYGLLSAASINIAGESYILSEIADITDRKRAEEALRRTLLELDGIFRALPDLYFRMNVDGTILDYRTSRMIDLYVPPDQFIGRQMQSVLPPDVSRQFDCALRELAQGQPQAVIEYVLPLPNGAQTFETRLLPLQEHQVIAVIRDITERKRAEEALRESEELYRLTLASIPDVVFITDDAGTLTFICANVYLIFGYSFEEAQTLGNIAKLLGAGLFDPAELARQEEIRNIERDITDQTGNVHSLLVTVKQITIRGGTRLYTCRDISDRKRMEEAFRKSEQQYRALAENVADGIAILREGKLVFVNQSLAAMLGYTKDRLLRLDYIDLLRPDYKELGRQKLILAEQGLAESAWQVSYVMNDGREIWTETYYSFIEWDGKTAILVTIKDITAHKVHALVVERDRERLWQENLTLRTTIKERYRFGEIIGKSPAMQAVYELMLKAAATNENVLIQGNSGTGKELIARSIHQLSARRRQQFVPVNCGAIPEPLFESEFFGYRKGAFTGAYANKPGFFDAAHKGTLFLDEVGELSPMMQVKLLRALDANGYMPVGDQTVKTSDVRIIAATNRSLEELLRKGIMREDFFYRIHVITITIPPLRERLEDIPLLIEHFLERLGNHAAHAVLPGDVLEQLYRYDWPGNVRELQNVLRRYVTIQELEFTSPFHAAPAAARALPTAGFITETDKLREAVEGFEKWFLTNVLAQHRWHRGETSAALDIPPRTLHRKMKKYQLI